MIATYISLRTIFLSAIVEGKSATGYMVYGYKHIQGEDDRMYEDYIDKAILQSIPSGYSPKLFVHNMLDNTSWVKLYTLLSREPVQYLVSPSLSQDDMYNISAIAPETFYPAIKVEYYPSMSAYKDAPWYPFDGINLYYNIGSTCKDINFANGLHAFCNEHCVVYSQVEQSLKFNNISARTIFDTFIKRFGKKVSGMWPSINNLMIDVYDENHLKPFATSSIMPTYFWKDSPFTSFPFRLTEYGTIEQDIIENHNLCVVSQLTDIEIYALLIHELGHFDQKANGITQFQSQLHEEILCDNYAINFGLGNELKTALVKLIASKQCSEQQNRDMRQRIIAIKNVVP